MHHTVTFVGSDADKLDQAWEATLDYLGDLADKLESIRAEQNTVGNPEAAKFVALNIGIFWGIEGYYPIKAIEQYMLGERTI